MEKSRRYRQIIIYLLALIGISILASLPALRSGVAKGHDLAFHLGRIQSLACELKNGQFPVRYESDAWSGYGYVSSLFYGHTLLYVPAFLYMCGMPVYRAYNIYVIMINMLTAVLGYYSFKGLFKDNRWAMLGTLLYTMSAYRVSNLYVRAAVGEYTAMAFVPLVIYGIYRLYFEYNDFRDCIPVVVGVSGMIESHVLATELVAMCVVVFAIVFIKTTISRIIPIVISLLAVLMLNAYFIVPFLDGYKNMQLNIYSVEQAEDLTRNGLYLKQFVNLFPAGYGSNYEWSTENESYLGMGILILICLISAIVALVIDIRKKSVNKKFVTMLSMAVAAGFVSTVYFPWKIFSGKSAIAKFMAAVQYPWRYMIIVVACLVVVGVYGFIRIADVVAESENAKPKHIVYFHKRGETSHGIYVNKSYIKIATVISVLAVGSAAYFDYSLVCANQTVANQSADETWADRLYLPVGTDSGLFESEIAIDTESGIALLPKLAFDHLEVMDAQGNVINHTVGENNRIQISLADVDENSLENISVRYVEPVGYRVAEIVSLLAFVGIMVYYALSKKSA